MAVLVRLRLLRTCRSFTLQPLIEHRGIPVSGQLSEVEGLNVSSLCQKLLGAQTQDSSFCQEVETAT